MAAGKCQSVAGPVQVFHEEPYEGRARPDTISVGGVCFTLREYGDSTGYHQTISHGSPLRSGATARLLYCPYKGRKVILKVELGPPSSGEQPASQAVPPASQPAAAPEGPPGGARSPCTPPPKVPQLPTFRAHRQAGAPGHGP